MTGRLQCEFFLIRYVPDVVRGEFINIGVLLRKMEQQGSAIVRFTRNWDRVRCLGRDVDTEMLESLEAELAQRALDTSTAQKPIVELLQETLSNSIQISPAHACLAESLPAELDQLMRMYVNPLQRNRQPRLRGRAALAGTLRREFERAGVWALMRKHIAASAYTRAGDPLTLDCGYRSVDTVRIFHAVSLEGDVEVAKILAYSAPRLREGVRQVDGALLEMTAVVEPVSDVGTDPEKTERYRYGVASMEEQQIRVLTVRDLGRAAETAKRELLL